MKSQRWLLVALAVAAMLGGCSSPEESARAALTEAADDWQAALREPDPQKRVAIFGNVIETLEGIVEDYPETPDGRAIASGRQVVAGYTLANLRATRDELAARASCYSSPTVDCLTPFASQNMRGASAGEGSADAVFAAAQKAVCDKGFAAADRMLEPFKINRPAYAQELVQVALAAAQCDKPREVVAAIDAYRASGAGADKLLSIVSTDALRPAWPAVMADLEKMLAAGGLPQNDAASIVLTMAVRYAALGDTRAAMDKYRYFTDTLRYQADMQTQFELGAALITAGAGADGIAVVHNPNTRSPVVVTVHMAAKGLAEEVGLLQGMSPPFLLHVKDIRDYFAPVAASERQRIAASSDAIEAELDKLAPVVTVQDGVITALDTSYAALALVQQKLGAADKANKLVGKGNALRDRLLPAAAQKNIGLDQYNAHVALVALAQGRHAEAAELVQAIGSRSYHVRLILTSYAAKCGLEECLAMANTIDRNVPQSFTTVIEALIAEGRLADAERAIAAFAGNADVKNGMYWMLVQQAAAAGDVKDAEKFVEKYSLVARPQDRLRFLGLVLGAEKVAANRRQAEPLIRELFTIGNQLDASGSDSRNAIAQNAAWHAFHNGYTDLGIELYTAASRKDQRPMFEAFNDKLNKRDMPVLLMLAHDNLRGETLGYVIDAAIRYLNGEKV